MMRSLYSGVAGLKTHQTKMDVIGNNIANVNTAAFKSSSIVFNELMSQTTQRASGPNALTGTGGTNARQIGLGVKSGAININITGQGSTQSTGNPFDIMIYGENFFIVNNGVDNYFTRDGSFYIDGAGNLAMSSTGYNVMGWQVDPDTGDIRQDTVTALRIMSTANMTYPPEATSMANISGIIDKNDKDVNSVNGKVVNLNFFDALGYSYTAKFVFKQSGNSNEYSLELKKILDSTGKEIELTEEQMQTIFGTASQQFKESQVSFDDSTYYWDNSVLKLKADDTVLANLSDIFAADGTLKEKNEPGAVLTSKTVQEQLDAIAKAYGYEGSTDEFLNLLFAPPTSATDDTPMDPPLSVLTMLYNLSKSSTTPVDSGDGYTLRTEGSFTSIGRNFYGEWIKFDPDKGTFAGVRGQLANITSIFRASVLGNNFTDITIDFSETSMYDNKGTSTVGAMSGDLDGLGTGRRLGEMIGVSIQQDGRIYASYDNGMTRLLGQIASARFANASGLEKSGDNLYSATMNSGEFDGIGEDITVGGGYMTTGQLEMSNVDLSAEFTEMITTQRGFQANSRIITVSDTLLEELTNLKR